jgi:cyclopropane-fatty-acyl-phospholipid synthase
MSMDAETLRPSPLLPDPAAVLPAIEASLREALSMPNVPAAIRMVMAVTPRFEFGSLTLVLPDGRRVLFRGRQPGPDAVWQFNDASAASKFFTGGAVAWAEAYMDRQWDTPNLEAIIEFFAANDPAIEAMLQGKLWYRALRRVQHLLRRNSKPGAKRNIAYHYDLGNDFYAEWLDPSMTYSAAMFRSENDALERAQEEKYRRLAAAMRLEPGQSVLELGCGWGGFAELAAREFGAKVTAITVSREQFDFARQRIASAGLNEQVEIRLQDYRDVTGQFDRIASIEMFEAVGESYWPTYFRRLAERMKPQGLAGLQIITIADRYFETYRRGTDFIQKYIFPGGMLPSPTALGREIKGAGLRAVNTYRFGQDYARTLELWQRRFQDSWPRIEAMGFDPRFKRMWEYYLAYCRAGFSVGFTDVVQLAVAKA